jgi:hypothetical protein
MHWDEKCLEIKLEKHERKRPVDKSRRRWNGTVKNDVKLMGCELMG